MNNKIFFLLSIFVISCSNQVPTSNQVSVKESNLVKETNLKKSIIDIDFDTAVSLLADEDIKKAIEKAEVVEINGFKILYAAPNEIFVIKDSNVIARINDMDKTLYHSTFAPLAGKEVYLQDNLLVYNNSNNSFIDYGIDGVDVIETNQIDILNTKLSPNSAKLPNTAIINKKICQTFNNSSRSACCGKVGYVFTFEKGWETQQQMTEKCAFAAEY